MKNTLWYIAITIFLGFFIILFIAPFFIRSTFGDFVHESKDDFDERQKKDFIQSYLQAIKEYPIDLIDHFPRELKKRESLSAITPADAYAYNMALLLLWIDADSSEITDLKKRLKKANALTFIPNDTSLIIVGDTIDYSKKSNGIPIPSFYSYEKDFGLNSTRLDNEFIIYILESKSGEYMKKEYLTTANKFPSHWKNGFSRGIAINEEERKILYWTTIW